MRANDGNVNGRGCSKEEVFDILSDKKWHTTAAMAEELGVSSPTIGNRVKGLVADGWPVLAGRNGYCLVEAEDITDEEEAREIERMMRRMVAIVMRQALVAKPMKRLAARARKLLPKSKEERGIIRRYLVQLTHLIDFQDIEDME